MQSNQITVGYGVGGKIKGGGGRGRGEKRKARELRLHHNDGVYNRDTRNYISSKNIKWTGMCCHKSQIFLLYITDKDIGLYNAPGVILRFHIL